jgi:serine/threonine protein kinase
VVTSRVTEVGKYKLTRLIGEGGMGSVYLAVDTVLERQVAVKILHSHLCRSEEMRERFRNEAKTHGKLEHPNIVRVYDFVISEELLLIAMEFVAGGRNLGDLIKGTPLPQRVACDVLRQVLRGVAFAHGEGVVHRDIKPPNILIGEERGRIRPRLTDFGIAKALHTSSMTQPGSVLGTVDYMSPEQCLGKPVDQRSDLYSIGVVFYECLTGRVPFQAATEYQVMQAHVDNVPERPDRYNADLLPGLVALCLRALEKEPEKRYQSANAILDDLDALASDLDRLPDEPLILPPPRVTLGSADDVGEDSLTGAPMQEAPTAFAGVPSQPQSSIRSGPAVGVSARAPTAGAVPVRVSTRSIDGPVTTSAASEEVPPARRKGHGVAWLLLVLLLVGGGAAAFYWFRLREVGEPSGPAAGNSPAAVATSEADAVRRLVDGGKFVEVLERLLPLLAPAEGKAEAADVGLLADLLEKSGSVLPPERLAQAAQALEGVLAKDAAGAVPPVEVLAAALRGAKAIGEAGALARATSIVAAAVALEPDPELAVSAFGALATAVEGAASFDEAFAVVRLLSGIPPNSALYEPARRALGTAKDAMLVRERGAAEDALRAGRWTEARTTLARLQKDLGDTRESTRQLELKAKDLEGIPTGGPCLPVGLVRLRDPTAASRSVGRPQLAWTGEDYLVVWSDGRASPENSAAQQVFLQRLDASGKRLIQSDQVVSAPGADAARPTIDCLDKQCGVVWDELVSNERRVVFRAVDFLGNPVAEPITLATGVTPAAYPTVAAARNGTAVTFAVAWAGREAADAERSVMRDSAGVAFLDHEGKLLDGPRYVRAPPPEEPANVRRNGRAARPRVSVTRLPHVVGMGDDGFALAWEEEGDGLVAVMLGAFASAGGDPRWIQKVLPNDTPSRSVEGRIPFLAFHPGTKRIAVLWVDRAPINDELEVSLFDGAGTALGTSVAARGTFRYHGGLFIDEQLLAARWSRAAARLGLTLCPLNGTCPPPPESEDPADGIPLAGLGGRVGLAPGAARGEFAAVWRERPGLATADGGGETEDAPSVGDEIFFVRFRCGAQ